MTTILIMVGTAAWLSVGYVGVAIGMNELERRFPEQGPASKALYLTAIFGPFNLLAAVFISAKP